MKPIYRLLVDKIAALILSLLILTLSPHLVKSSPLSNDFDSETSFEFSEPELIGDSEICMVLGRTIGIYSAGGNEGDVYEWKVINSDGEEIFNRSGGQQFETIKVVFTTIGEYTVYLKVRRGTNSDYYQNLMTVTVQEGPKLALLPDYLLCGDNPVVLTALDPTVQNIEKYSIIWRDLGGNELGRGNEYTTAVSGIYLVEIFLENPGGSQVCTINGSTFVGPAIDFQITKSATKICEGGSIKFSTDTPLNGEWFVKKLPNGNKEKAGNGYNINLSSSELGGIGQYEVSFRVPSMDFPDCPSERKTLVEVTEGPQIDVQILEKPDECSIENGSFQVIAKSNLESLTIEELGFSKKNVSAGQIFTFDNLEAKLYVVSAGKNGCVNNVPVRLTFDDVPGSSPFNPQNLTVSFTNESCVGNQTLPGTISVSLENAVAEGEFRIFSSGGGTIKSGPIPSDGKIEADLYSGTYHVEVTQGTCTYPIESIKILNQPQVEVSIPEKISICESFYFVPETSDQLRFTLTTPSGATQTSKTGEGFTLTEKGKYSLLAEPLDPNSGMCAKKLEFSATLLASFTFKPVLVEEGCFDPIRYRAQIEGNNEGKVSYRWFNEQGTIVGRSQELYPPSVGKFSLLITPTGSGYCPIEPVEFEVVAPITNVPMDLGLGSSCEEPDAVQISLVTDMKEVVSTEWIFYDESNVRQELVEFDDLYEVEVRTSGTYEVVSYNKLGCEIGRNFKYVEVKPLYSLPELEESYPVCSLKNSIKPIDPGEYAAYEWYFEDQLVSTERLFKPDRIGNYQLLVTTVDGCVLEDTFSTNDVCNYQVVYPNAMVLGNPEKEFEITMKGVTEAELIVLNRQGELIYHSLSSTTMLETSVLSWDGRSNGKFVPAGNYVVIIKLRNSEFGLEEKKTGTLLILS